MQIIASSGYFNDLFQKKIKMKNIRVSPNQLDEIDTLDIE
jgi:hypothetical protein